MFHDSERSALRRLLSFSIPIFFTNFLQVFYALTDMAVVGRFVGGSGLAAIANGSIIAYLVGSVGTGLAVGGAVVIGHYNGAADALGRRRSLTALLMLATLVAGLLTPFGILFAADIFYFLEVSEEAFAGAIDYLVVMSCGNVFFFVGTALSFSLRSLGDSRSPLYFMLAGGLVNVALDFVLVGGFGLGVRGAALATVTAQGSSIGFAFLYLRQRGFFHEFTRSDFRPRPEHLRRIVRLGLPVMIQLVLINSSYLAITALINGYGVIAAAAAGVGIKICTLAVMPCWAVGQALTALAANSLGGGRQAEAEALTKTALKLNLALTALVVLGVQLAAGPLMAVFNPGVIGEGVRYLRFCCSLGVVLYAVMYTFNSLATGAGAATVAMLNSLLDAVVMRLLLIGLLSGLLGYGLVGIYLGQALSALLPALAGGLYFYSRRWQRKKVI